MTKQSKVSVIVPIYNVERFLCQAVNSILNQTLSEYNSIEPTLGALKLFREIQGE